MLSNKMLKGSKSELKVRVKFGLGIKKKEIKKFKLLKIK